MASHSSRKVIFAALIGNSLIAVTKFIAAAITGSSAMLSEGIHSVVDTGNQVLLLYGLKRGARPADKQFPYGYGKEVYFWSFVVAILIFAIGAGVSVYEGIHHLAQPEPISQPVVNYIVLLLGIVFEGGSCLVAFREFNKVKGTDGYITAIHKSKDPAMFIVLFEDVAAIAGLVVALIGVALVHTTGLLIFDGIASIIIGIILGITALFLAFETKSLLIGESADPEKVTAIEQIFSQYESVSQVNEVLTMHVGPSFILLNVSVDFKDNIPAGEVETIIAEISTAIKQKFPLIKRIFIEAESAKN